MNLKKFLTCGFENVDPLVRNINIDVMKMSADQSLLKFNETLTIKKLNR